MKRNILFLLTAILAGLLSSCVDIGTEIYDPNERAFDAWLKTDEIIRAADSFEISINEILVLFDNNDSGYEISNAGTVKQITRSDDDIDFEISLKLTSGDTTNRVDGYYTGGYMHYNYQDSKYKRLTDAESAKREVYADILDLSSLPIKSSSITEVKGGRMLTFALDGSSDIFDFTKDSIAYSFNLSNDKEGAEPTKIEIENDVIYKVEIDKNYNFKTITMAFTADITFLGAGLKTYYEITKKAIKIGGVTIKFPADLNEYIDITDSQ